MYKLQILITILFSGVSLFAQQVPLNGVIEHFTNTRCSICASRNPGLLQNVRNNSFLYVSVHPSAPYSSCMLSRQNKILNDNRTNFYGVYGSTPRIVVNGYVYAGNEDYTSSTIFEPFKLLLTSFTLSIDAFQRNADSISYQVVIKKHDTSSLTQASLSNMLLEDTIWGDGGNGEAEHYNVMRSNVQQVISLPQQVNDSIIFSVSHKIQSYWNLLRVFPLSLIQQTNTKSLIQSAKGNYLKLQTGVIEDSNESKLTKIYPNPSSAVVYINAPIGYQYEFINALGVSVLKGTLATVNRINIDYLAKGIYVVKINSTDNSVCESHKLFVN